MTLRGLLGRLACACAAVMGVGAVVTMPTGMPAAALAMDTGGTPAMPCGTSGAQTAQVLQNAAQPPLERRDVFAFVRALDETASRAAWPGFGTSAIPVALFDGENTILLRHPTPPAEFSPIPGRPGVFVARGRHPLSDGVRRLTIAGVQGAPKVGGGEGAVSVEAPGVRLTLRGAEAHVVGDLIRILVRGPRP